MIEGVCFFCDPFPMSMVKRLLLSSARFPVPGLALLYGLYTLASLAHFAHNAEFISLYPGLPVWLDREMVYQAWLVVAALGALGLVLVGTGWSVSGALVIAAYGGLGLDGLLHYRLGPCTGHTWGANLTIFAEALSGSVLALAASVWAWRQLALRRALLA